MPGTPPPGARVVPFADLVTGVTPATPVARLTGPPDDGHAGDTGEAGDAGAARADRVSGGVRAAPVLVAPSAPGDDGAAGAAVPDAASAVHAGGASGTSEIVARLEHGPVGGSRAAVVDLDALTGGRPAPGPATGAGARRRRGRAGAPVVADGAAPAAGSTRPPATGHGGGATWAGSAQGPAARGGPDGSRSTGDRTTDERTGGDRTGGDRSSGDWTGGDPTSGGRASRGRTRSDRTGGDRTGGDRSKGDRSGDDRIRGDRTTRRRAAGGGPRGGRSADGSPADDDAADPESVARAICLRLLTDRARTRQELAQALRRKGVPDDAAVAVLGRFDEVGLVDDRAFADQWVRSRHGHRGLGRRALAVELRRKGVADEIAVDAVAAVDDAAEERRARDLVERRLRGLRTDTPELRAAAGRKLLGMLARKGYGGGVAYRVVREVLAARGADTDEIGDDPPTD